VNPDLRFGSTLAASLLLWTPSLLALLHGDIPLHSALMWYTGALVIAWLGFGLLDWLIVSFTRSNIERQAPTSNVSEQNVAGSVHDDGDHGSRDRSQVSAPIEQADV
jgi:hypothetical protein